MRDQARSRSDDQGAEIVRRKPPQDVKNVTKISGALHPRRVGPRWRHCLASRAGRVSPRSRPRLASAGGAWAVSTSRRCPAAFAPVVETLRSPIAMAISRELLGRAQVRPLFGLVQRTVVAADAKSRPARRPREPTSSVPEPVTVAQPATQPRHRK